MAITITQINKFSRSLMDNIYGDGSQYIRDLPPLQQTNSYHRCGFCGTYQVLGKVASCTQCGGPIEVGQGLKLPQEVGASGDCLTTPTVSSWDSRFGSSRDYRWVSPLVRRAF